MTCVGLFGPAGDAEVALLARRLRARGAEPWIIDLAGLPARLAITAHERGFRVDGRPLLEMHAAYLRRVGTRLPPLASHPGAAPTRGWEGSRDAIVERLHAERARQALRESLVRALARARPVVNAPEKQPLHRLKAFQLGRLRRAGLPVPKLLAGSDPRPLREFAGRGETVDKPPAGIYKTVAWSDTAWAEHPWGRRPALYQRRVRGDVVRAFVLDGRLLSAARIVHGATVDSSESQTGIEVLELPGEAARVAIAAARELGLPFAGVDLVCASDGWWLIDCNLSPMFANYGRLSRCDVAGALADHLLALTGRERQPAVLELVETAKELLASDPEIAAQLRTERGP